MVAACNVLLGVALDLVTIAGLGTIAFVAALGALAVSSGVERRRARPAPSIFGDGNPGTVFLFDGEVLVDSSAQARAFLAALAPGETVWGRLSRHLRMTFPGAEQELADLPEKGVVSLTSLPGQGAPMMMRAEMRGGLLRISLADTGARPGEGPDPFTFAALRTEVDDLRDVTERMPTLCWREGPEGEIIWANRAYLLQVVDMLTPGQELCWPLPRLFDRAAASRGGTGQRARLAPEGGKARWFDLPGSGADGGRLFFAIPADPVVQAETSLQDFMQTLTKTFAQLPTGLAIFDRHRQLQLFNPALVDLTGLPPDFLMLRPSLLSVLDALRDHNMLPEPKDYRTWRQQLVSIEKRAAEGLYEETWNLPDGQTFRVTGRPHPNGALALMIEDISTEMLRTRRYRADLELGQSVIDAMDEAVAVFSREGHLVMTNAAYGALWGEDPAISLGEATVRRMADRWRGQSAPGALWAEVEDYVSTIGDRKPWAAEVRLRDGRLLDCRFVPLSGGATLVAFRRGGAETESALLAATG